MELSSKTLLEEIFSIKNPNANMSQLKQPMIYEISDTDKKPNKKPETKPFHRKIEENFICSTLLDFTQNKRISVIPQLKHGKIVDFEVIQQQAGSKGNQGKSSSKRYVTADNSSEKHKAATKKNRKGKYHADYNKHIYNYINKEEKEGKRREFSIDIDEKFGEPFRTFYYDELDDQTFQDAQTKPIIIHQTGHLLRYDRSIDKVTPRNPLQLKLSQRPEVSHVKKYIKDEIVMRSVEEKSANIFISDLLLATIMASKKSAVAWDVKIEKIGGNLFFYKRKESAIDKEIAEENSKLPMKKIVKAFVEAESIKENFLASALEPSGCIALDEQQGLDDIDLNLLSPVDPQHLEPPLVYKIFPLSESLRVLVKCQLDSFETTPYSKAASLLQVKVLHELDKNSHNNWNAKLEIQKGGVLVDEVRKNAFKVSRWVAQSYVSGCKDVSIAFVSRSKKNHSQFVQATIKETFSNLGYQLGASSSNYWGIFRLIAEQLVAENEDGKFLLVKDPNNVILFELVLAV